MEISALKEYIFSNNQIPIILEKLGCNNIINHGNYYSCSNPDGDNPSAISVYNCELLYTLDYTRDIGGGRNSTDIVDLVKFFLQCSLFETIQVLCNWLEIDYYYDFDEELPESIKLTKFLMEMAISDTEEYENIPLKPIPETVLHYYPVRVNDLFKNDGIDYTTQYEFEIGYDAFSNRITIPIRDEIGNLVGVKGRLFKTELGKDENKYLSIEKYCKSKVLYGLYKTLPHILRSKKVYVAESEKAVMQLWSNGVCNSVATGGKKISTSQIEKLSRLCVDIIFIYDKDVSQEEIQNISDRFIDEVNVFAVIDKDDILDEKESPTDNIDKFYKLIKNNVYKIGGR